MEDNDNDKGKRKRDEIPQSDSSEEEGSPPVPPKKKGKKGTFRINSAQLFCTWPHSDGISKEEAVEQLDAKLDGNLKEYLIAEEEHEVKDFFPYPQGLSAMDYVQWAETRAYLMIKYKVSPWIFL